MKKSILSYILIIIIILSSFLFIINKKQNQNSKEIIFLTLQLGTFDNYVNKVISNFEKENPEYKIKWIDIPYSEGEKRTLAAILTDNPPDLVNLTPDFSLVLAKKNALKTIKKEELTQFLPSIIEALKLDDKYFGIPFYATSAVTLYNKDLSNKKISTYDELFKLKTIDNSYITMFNFSENDTLLKLLNKYNINSPTNINSEKSVEIFKKFKYLFDNNLIPKESITQSHREALEKYMSGQLAYIVTGANFLNIIKENAPEIYKKTEILPQLVGNTGKYDYSLMNMIIPVKAKNKDGALKFALYFTNEENQLEFSKLTGVLPTNINSLKNSYFTHLNNDTLEEKARIICSKQLTNIQPSIKNIKNKKELNTLSANYVQEILIRDKDIKTTLDEFAQDWQKL